MAIWRLMKNSVRFAFRAKKRWITFVVIFAFLSGFVTFFAGSFNQYSTELLLEQKGFYLQSQSGGVNDSLANAIISQLESFSGIEKVAKFRYFDLGDYIRVYGVSPADRWLFDDAKPSLILTGHYATGPNEAVISRNTTIKADLGSFSGNVSATLHRGDTIIMENNNSVVFELNIVGEIRDTVNAPNKLRMYITNTDFDFLYTNFGASAPIFCESIAVLVQGQLYAPFNTEIYDNMIKYDEATEPLFTLVNTGSYGSWNAPEFKNPDTTKKDRATSYLSFIFGIIGGILLTILYNFLIVWFRRREVAVLRAMGYEKREIRINLIGESLTISFVGYVVGILAIIIWFGIQRMTFTNQLITGWTLLISFCIVVGITIPGLLLSSISFVRVSPVILFKAR